MIHLEKHNEIHVLRDDLLPGGTKSVLMPFIVGEAQEYVYASPVYGGFQIALASYCKQQNKKATIFCAKRKTRHKNTLKLIELGANVIEIPYGYLSVIEKHARDYCKTTGAEKITFGASTELNKKIITERVKKVVASMENEPDEIWCAIGSGTLVESILNGTKTAKIYGVQVGMECTLKHARLEVLKYHDKFEKESKFKKTFESMENYDLKAWEYCNKYKKSTNVLFWNVL